MNCEHCGTGLDCPTCNANEVARLGRKIDLLKTQAKRTIFIYIPITITVTLSLLGSGAIKAIWEIFINGGIPIPVLSVTPSEPMKPYVQERILANSGLTKSFTVTNVVEQVQLNVDINYLGHESNSLRLFLLNEEEFENYKRGVPPEGLADSIGIQNLGYNGTLPQGTYYILFLNPSDQDITADIITNLKRSAPDAYEYN
ncbi:MAG: hypothetical protein AB7H86_04040 [Blastocatellales bacterium]